MVGRALVTKLGVWPLFCYTFGESGCKPGFADSRLARDQNDLPLAFPRRMLPP